MKRLHATLCRLTLGRLTLGRLTLGRLTLGRLTLGRLTLGRLTLGRLTLGRLTLGRLTLVLLAFTQLGCGYGLVGRGTNIPDHVQRVYLTPLENATRRSEVDQILTRALAEEMVARRRFTLVNEVGQSDAVLAGQVILFDVTPLSFDDEGRATEYQITITVGMSFRDRAADSVLWQNDRYVYKESYQVERPDEPYFDREKLAIESAAGRFARTVLVDLLEGF